jgi:RecB family exonuclease
VTTFDSTFATPIPWIVAQLEHVRAMAGRRAVVLVGAERQAQAQAHALRRHVCVAQARPELLAGVLLLRPVDLAREILVRAGRVHLPGWEAIRRLRILQLFASSALADELRYFSAEQLRAGHGYVDAFARTIADLEDSGLDAALTHTIADALATDDGSAAHRLHDVALTWSRVDRDSTASGCAAGRYATVPQLLSEATATVSAQPEVVVPLGAIFAVLTSSPSTVLLRFLRALPGCRAIFQDARPLRTDTQRWRPLMASGPASPGTQLPLFGTGAGSRLDTAAPAESELQLVQRFLFELPETLTDPQRPRSGGADGSVDLEDHPSLEEEIEAAATWVIEQLAAGIPAEDIALIVPELDPYATLLTDRLRRLSGGGTALRGYVEGGLPLAESPAGLRLQTLMTALARSLEAEATIRLLPALRRADHGNDEPSRPLSASRAANMAYGAGIVGGNPADPTGLCEWVPRLTRRRDALRKLVEDADAATAERSDEPEKRRHTVDRQQAQRRLHEIDALLPAVTALQHLAEDIIGGTSVRTTWAQIRAFAQTWLRLPPDPPNLLATFDQQLQPLLADPLAMHVTGLSALHFLIEELRRDRRPTGRFGEPAVFIGTPAHAAGLPFAAVRILGLAEGAVPHTPHDDPIVPDGMRKRIEEIARTQRPDVVVPRLADQVLDEIHAVFRVVSATRQRLALSAPRQWVDRSEREVSGIMLEVATALGRRLPGHAEEGDVPTAARLRAVYLNPGRAARRQAAGAAPLSPRTQIADTPTPSPRGIVVPAEWMRGAARALDRVHALTAALRAVAVTGIDGVVTGAWSAVQPPGLLPQRPISASALTVLLSCPHRFLLERILHLNQPASRPSTDAIDPIAYGALFHAAAERFFHEAGRALCARAGDVDAWVARAQAIAAEQFEQLRDEYPLRGSGAIERARDRLLRQTEQLVRDEWQRPVREYLASELSFGDPTPVRLVIDDGELYVRGAIDRLDRISGGGLSVRDLKTGRVHDLSEDPMNAGRDLQIGLYTLVLEALGAPTNEATAARVVEAAYVHPSATQEPDRAFAGAELDLLRQRTRNWLAVAHRLLSAGTFPRTPNPDDCRYCPFVPACGDGAQQRSAMKLRSLPDGDPLQSFMRFKEESRRDEG